MTTKMRAGAGMRRRALLAAVAAAALLTAPVPAAARVTVSVEFAYGGIVVGGVGFFVYFAGYWESGLALRDVPTALVEFSGGSARLGIPLPAPRLAPDAPDDAGSSEADGLTFDLLRWRF